MAITDKIVITGTAGGENGLTNVGTNANNTWATSGNPTYASTGILQQGTDGGGMSAINITTAANRGTLTPWSGSDPKPVNMTGPSFLRMPAAHVNLAFTLLSDAMTTALNSTATSAPGAGATAEEEFEDGYLFTSWFRIYTDPAAIKHTAEPTITPPHNPGALAFHDVQTSGGSSFGQFRGNFYNLSGFRPSVLVSNGNYTSQTEDVLPISGGGGSSLPLGHINVNEWYPFQVWVRRATGSAAADGEIRWYVGGALVMRTTGISTWWASNAWRLQYFAGMLSGYTSARTGVQFDFGCPLKFQVVPEADLPSAIITNWERNTELSLDLRRHWPVQCPVHPVTITTVTGTPNAPTFGRVLNTSGVYPGMCELPLGGDADEEQMAEFPAVWDGVDDEDSPFGEEGWTYVSLDTCNPQGSRVAWRIRNAADNGNLIEVVLDDSGTGTFSINGTEELSGRTDLPAHTRWQIVLALSETGDARVALADISTATFTVRALQWFEATTTYVGGAIGKPQASVRNVNAATGRIGSCSVFGSNTWVVGDSYSGDAMATNTYAISGVNQGTKTLTVSTMQSGSAKSRKPVSGDSVKVTGSNDGWYTVASATDTTIVTVEALPSATANGSVDITAPSFASTANRMMQAMPNRDGASAIAPHYLRNHPLLTSPLRGWHCLFNLARSGQALTGIISNVLPQCLLSPPPKVLMMCFDVNDSSNTGTVDDMTAQAQELAASKKEFADFIAARDGLLIVGASFNGENAGGVMNGWAARFRRVTMAQAHESFRDLVNADRAMDGHVVCIDPSKYLASGTIRASSDGLHPDNQTALDYVTGLFIGYEAIVDLPGFNDDGSMIIGSRNGLLGAVGSPIGF